MSRATVLSIYRALAGFALPLMLRRRRKSGRETDQTITERLCLDELRAPTTGRPIWVHAASVGEAEAARRLVTRITGAGFSVLLTVNSVTARARVGDWGNARVAVRLAPLDTAPAVDRFLTAFHPLCLAVVEQEIWPLRAAACAAHGIPLFGISTRLSGAHLTARWPLRSLRDAALAPVRRFWPLDETAKAGLRQIGVTEARIGAVYNPKLARFAEPLVETAPDPALAAWADDPIVVCVSTHPGDDEDFVSAMLAARDRGGPRWRMILAPRHPDRAEGIIAALHAAGMTVAVRSRSEHVTEMTDICIADTLGELATLLEPAALAVIGGSFGRLGGHDPVEAVSGHAVPVFGPDMANHRIAAQVLKDAGGAMEIANRAGLADLLAQDPEKLDLHGMAARGRNALAVLAQSMRDVEDEIVAALTGWDGSGGEMPDADTGPTPLDASG